MDLLYFLYNQAWYFQYKGTVLLFHNPTKIGIIVLQGVAPLLFVQFSDVELARVLV